MLLTHAIVLSAWLRFSVARNEFEDTNLFNLPNGTLEDMFSGGQDSMSRSLFASDASAASFERKTGLSCKIRRYENIYFFGQLLGAEENVTKVSTCAYLCWSKRADEKPCASVNYLKSMQKCEFMRDVFNLKDTALIGSHAHGNRDSVYVVPLSCGNGTGSSQPFPSGTNPPLAASGNSTHLYQLPRRGNCGQSFVSSRMSSSVERIVGGSEARPHSHPWIVSLQRGKSHFCGGSLVRVNNNNDKSDIVVTAAHCVARPPLNMQVRAGAHSLRRSSKGEERVKVKKTVVHPNYSHRSQQHDIAVVVLESPIQFTSTIQPVCLPGQGDQVQDGSRVYVVGWGNRREGGSPASDLMEVVVPVISSRECSSNYGSRMPIYPQSMLCAGVQGKDSCQGDSGGPLTVRSGNSYVLEGVVSFGDGCARARKPGVYARVASYVNWINDQIRSLSAL